MSINPIIDQIAHWVWAFVVVWICMKFSGEWWAGLSAGLLIALPRELIDQWPIGDWFDTVVDIFFFGIAGLIVTIL